jgi:hypothetical protein
MLLASRLVVVGACAAWPCGCASRNTRREVLGPVPRPAHHANAPDKRPSARPASRTGPLSAAQGRLTMATQVPERSESNSLRACSLQSLRSASPCRRRCRGPNRRGRLPPATLASFA